MRPIRTPLSIMHAMPVNGPANDFGKSKIHGEAGINSTIPDSPLSAGFVVAEYITKAKSDATKRA